MERALSNHNLTDRAAQALPLAWHSITRRHGINAVIAAFCLALIGIFWAAVVTLIELDRRATIENAIKQNSNLARAFEEHTIRTIKGFDAAVLFVAHEYARLGNKIDIAGYVKDGILDGKLFINLGVTNEHGDMLASSQPRPGPINIADRDYFKVHTLHDSGRLYFSKPVQSRITGNWTFPMSRRITKPDGSFGGIVSVAVDPRYFSDFYQQADLGEHGVVDLIGLDGISRARRRGNVANVGFDHANTKLLAARTEKAAGTLLTRGLNDGIQRYLSYRTLPDYPLFITVGSSQADVLAPHQQRKNEYYLAATLVSLVIALMGALLMLALTRQRRAISALAASEEKFRATFNHAAIGISHVDLNGRIIQINQKLCEMVGYTRDEMLAMTVIDFGLPEDRALDAELQAQLIAGRIPTYSAERQLARKDGTLIWVHRTVSLVRDDAGAPLYIIRVIEDITARKQMEEELLERTAEVRRAEEETRMLNLDLEKRVQLRTAELGHALTELETFSYSVSHDLRAPLRHIDGFGTMLLEKHHEQVNDDGKRLLQKIIAATRRMGQLTDDLLNLSRITRRPLAIGRVNLSAMAREIIGNHQERTPGRQIEAVVEPEISVYADSGLLRIVLDNLIGNAWKFTSKMAHAQITVGSIQTEHGPACYVRDNGAGFDMTYSNKLFAPFQRLHTANEFDGTGIGLATVKRIIQRHHGKVWAESSVGGGTTVFFTVAGNMQA
jgi:PAS domain S-box-containing protein